TSSAASDVYKRQPLLEKYAAQDSRIKLVFRSENGHISKATNSALEIATGEFVALLDNDDELAPVSYTHL
ncbi:glycosyltransferase, partial [Enterococcus sp. S181_ASV_20]|nr:glycosyltransferase [Enterococcus sp. S181_ASV_20]